MKVLIADSYYSDFLRSLPFDDGSNYETELRKVLDLAFGTADFYSRALSALGHDCVDVIVNHDRLQEMWARENGVTGDILTKQIDHHRPDVVFLQDLSITIGRGDYLLAGQCSCPMPSLTNIQKMDVLFTSFPHYVERFRKMGVSRVEYLPLAFDPIVLDGPQPERDIDISFVGGVGRNSHWRSGTDTLETIAERFGERFQWFGYGIDNLPASSALRACYRGEAWGRKMYGIYRRSKIVVNRHGEVAEGVANNLRMYEATGCGAMLLTDNKTDHFVNDEIVFYSSPADAIDMLDYFLIEEDRERNRIAANGQTRTLKDHTYAQRMPIVSDALKEMLCVSNA